MVMEVRVSGGGDGIPILGEQGSGYHDIQTLPQADLGQHFFPGLAAISFQKLFPLIRREGVRVCIEGAQGLMKQAFSQNFGLFVAQGTQIMTNFGTRLGGDHIIEPGRVGGCFGFRNDFHPVPIVQNGTEGGQLIVDLGGDTVMTDVCVDIVGKVHGRRTPYHGFDGSFGREDINGIRKQIDFDVFQKFYRITTFGLIFEQ